MESENCENVRVNESIARVETFLESNPVRLKDLNAVPHSVFATGGTKVTFLKSIFQNRAPTAFF